MSALQIASMNTHISSCIGRKAALLCVQRAGFHKEDQPYIKSNKHRMSVENKKCRQKQDMSLVEALQISLSHYPKGERLSVYIYLFVYLSTLLRVRNGLMFCGSCLKEDSD